MAQQRYNVGDYVEKDGIPCVVAYVDSTRMHGLLLSVRAITIDEGNLKTNDGIDSFIRTEYEKIDTILRVQYVAAKKYYAKNGTDQDVSRIDSIYALRKHILPLLFEMPKIVYTAAYNSIKRKEYKQILEELKTFNSGSGKQNTAKVINYCSANGLSLKDYFPQYYWVTQLGDGWFIPGNDELELLVKSFGVYEGVGSKYGVTCTVRAMKNILGNAVYKNVFYGYWGTLFLIDDHYWRALSGLASSTMIDGEWDKIKGNKRKTSIVQFADFANNKRVIYDKTTYYALQWTFGGLTTKAYMNFAKNVPSVYCAMIEF